MKLEKHYREDLAGNHWQADAAQLEVIEALQILSDTLERPAPFLDRILRRPAPAVTGLYLWGGVGRGKTYLMDLFYENVRHTPKMRQHFHRFMKQVHDQLRELKNTPDPLQNVAESIRKNARLICFDEFFVSDIADAMILGRLFTKLFDLGAVLVATSNVAPDNLYKDGLQRSQFLPAIDTLKHHTRVIHVDGAHDYRLQSLKGMDIYHYPHDATTDDLLLEYFRRIAPDSGTANQAIRVEGRDIDTIRRADSIVWFSFKAICDGPRGASDYIEIAQTFQTVIVSAVPQLDAEHENQARRFITMVDEFYDRRVNLILSAQVDLEQLYVGNRLQFEFKRTRSRLVEMQSADYLATSHLQTVHT